MKTLDDRARDAAQAITAAVSGVAPVAEALPAVARRRAVWKGIRVSAGAVAATAVIAVVALIAPQPEEVAETTTVPRPEVTTTVEASPTTVPTTVPTTIPEASTPVATTAPPTTAADTTPPELTVTSPEPEAHFETTVVTFRGTTEPGARVIAAGKFAAAVDAAGNWHIDLVLAPGRNGASFTATDAAGNQASASIAVWLDVAEPPKEEPPKEEPPKDVAFTAEAVYGSCSETPPYDVYHGTAQPGTTVAISSPYGAGSVTANADGHWEKKVVFATAPYGVTFVVTVTDHSGTSKSFEFVSWSTG